MAVTEIYVDPSIAASSGTGTSGDPYGDLQYALDQSSHDATNGTRFNIKAGSDEVLTAALSLTAYGTSTFTGSAPLMFQGYSAFAGDGGIGGISGAATYSIFNSSTADNVYFCDLHLHNCGSATIVRSDNNCQFTNCEFNNTSGKGIDCDSNSLICGCYVHDIGNVGIAPDSASTVIYCRLESGPTNTFTTAIDPVGTSGCRFINNTIELSGGSQNGILSGTGCLYIGNSIYGAGSSGAGIDNAGQQPMVLLNNTVEGFSGTGGEGITGTATPVLTGGNHAYNNTTNYIGFPGFYDYGDNEDRSAGGSPFTNAAAGDFTPADVGNMSEGALPAKIGLK